MTPSRRLTSSRHRRGSACINWHSRTVARYRKHRWRRGSLASPPLPRPTAKAASSFTISSLGNVSSRCGKCPIVGEFPRFFFVFIRWQHTSRSQRSVYPCEMKSSLASPRRPTSSVRFPLDIVAGMGMFCHLRKGTISKRRALPRQREEKKESLTLGQLMAINEGYPGH
jgi:hypothetical protein